jgi:hypothetical protein
MNAIDLNLVFTDASPEKLMPGTFTCVTKNSTAGTLSKLNLNCVGLAKSNVFGCLCIGLNSTIIISFSHTIYNAHKKRENPKVLPSLVYQVSYYDYIMFVT